MAGSQQRGCADLISRIRPFQKVAALIFITVGLSVCLPTVGSCQADLLRRIGPKAFIEYFRPIPLSGHLSKGVWGAATVGPRDPSNGLEDTTMQHWNYWDGKILRGLDGKYRMFASRWNQAKGHNAWFISQAVEAVSKSPLGPYHDEGLCWPGNQ